MTLAFVWDSQYSIIKAGREPHLSRENASGVAAFLAHHKRMVSITFSGYDATPAHDASLFLNIECRCIEADVAIG